MPLNVDRGDLRDRALWGPWSTPLTGWPLPLRILDAISSSPGCDLLLSEIALQGTCDIEVVPWFLV